MFKQLAQPRNENDMLDFFEAPTLASDSPASIGAIDGDFDAHADWQRELCRMVALWGSIVADN